ncbi:hypothetical protein [Breoghania sp. L-A4]|uniref:hypothetical protein n=1 Tax=Breoghania sp. L-A4 TaxID=2304600 RepID=UPI000E359677|nr:hypothetical protein [Breoghania sp. L-A4]AXS39266.1 hypothetical protein D1F64_03370 [Breoghania sp. L-A4]
MHRRSYDVAIAGFFAGAWKDVGETIALTDAQAKYLLIEGKIAPKTVASKPSDAVAGTPAKASRKAAPEPAEG